MSVGEPELKYNRVIGNWGIKMKSDGKCIYIYCDEKCECSECENCPHYRPDYKNETEEN